MLGSWSRWGPLTGVISALLGVAGAAVAIVTNSPGSDASGKEVIAFYVAQGRTQQIGVILLGLAFVFFVFFAGALRAHLRQTPNAEALSALVLAGAVLETVGQTAGAGYVWTLAQESGHLDPSAALGLNALSNDAVITNTAGMVVFGIAAGLAILRSGRLPRWLGWVAIAMGIVVMTPLEGFAFLALVIWMVIVSILIWRRSSESEPYHVTSAPSHGGIADG
jgi:hypothetical protein